ncbi:hydroxyacylglutathione hydrolase [Cardiosporidium cionae]|uniref:hydroxyacylglutathione hydrolase n=1 Tax=Cardiosporidium cionae TaxID=476202 RepID=A0ABQ7JDU1_9APIC|nr:hydroxyacylglutathione hydrolase [Cardiosporidium cionae]|eukprot:KAF8822044.1 hydroxyacylglutathione hydrolase [Cardiosporidium cionae]
MLGGCAAFRVGLFTAAISVAVGRAAISTTSTTFLECPLASSQEASWISYDLRLNAPWHGVMQQWAPFTSWKSFRRPHFSTGKLRHFCSVNLPPSFERNVSPQIDVIIIPIFKDNYSYILVDRATKDCVLVDPADPSKLIDVAKSKGLNIRTVLCTHKHWDHAGGNAKIAELLRGVSIVGPAYEEIPALTHKLFDKETLKFGENILIQLHFTPCHTKGHAVYYVSAIQGQQEFQPILFSGDTLFVGGCGRFFEGTATDMHAALQKIFSEFLPDTLVFCGHEYTLENLKFALSIEPHNPHLQNKLEWVKAVLAKNIPTIPSTLKEELLYNPFCRTHKQAIREALHISQEATASEVITRLRELKNKF